MNRNSQEELAGTVVGTAGVLTAGGVLTFALFPFLLPTVVLLGVLALPLLPLAVLGALVGGVYLLARSLLRLLGGRRRASRQRAAAKADRVAAPISPAEARSLQ